MLLLSSLNIRRISNSLVLGIAISGLLSTGLIITNSENALAIPQSQEAQINHHSLPQSLSKNSPKKSSKQLPKNLVNIVLNDASKRSGLAIKALKITQSKETNFSNSCVFNFGEVCAQIFDPIVGWDVIVKVKNQFWNYHIDQTGKQIVLDPKVTKK